MPESSAELTIRRATPQDVPKVLDFVRDQYGDAARFKGLDRFAWQYENSPFRPGEETDPTIWIAVDGEEVVGTIGVQDGAFLLEGQLHRAGWIVDVMVHPDYRGRGLSHRIHDAILKEREVLITLTMAAATRRVAERAGCVTLGPTRQYVLPHRISPETVKRYLDYKAQFGGKGRSRLISAFNKTLVGPWIASGLAQVLTGLKQVFSSDRLPEGYGVSEVDRFPKDVDDIWDAAKKHLPAVFERSQRFLNWRFVDCPGMSYRRFLLFRESRLVGYLVVRVGHPMELPVGVVTDFFADPEDGDALIALARLAVGKLAPDTEFLEAAASHPAWSAALRRAGFVATRTMRPTIVCADPALREKLRQMPDAWHFTKADHDWDQIHPV